MQTRERSSQTVSSELPSSISAATDGEEARLTRTVPRPIFVIGSLRSGANVLALSLGQHANITHVLDTTWVERFALGLQQAYTEDAARVELSQLNALGVDIHGFYAHFGEAINRLLLGPSLPPAAAPSHVLSHSWRDFGRIGCGNTGTTHRFQPTRWVDSCYTHVFNVAALQRLFPAARFIHTIRNVDEVVTALTSPENASIFKSRHVPFTPVDAYEHWLDAVTAGLQAELALGSETVLRISRANLMANSEAVLRQCLDFLDEPFDPQCLRPLRAGFAGTEKVMDTLPPIELDGIPPETRTQAEVLSFALFAEPPRTCPRPPDYALAARLVQDFVVRSEKSI